MVSPHIRSTSVIRPGFVCGWSCGAYFGMLVVQSYTGYGHFPTFFGSRHWRARSVMALLPLGRHDVFGLECVGRRVGGKVWLGDVVGFCAFFLSLSRSPSLSLSLPLSLPIPGFHPGLLEFDRCAVLWYVGTAADFVFCR